MNYIQFLHKSTGYIPGSLPPKFDQKYVKPIPMCGSDDIYIFDGRIHNKQFMLSIALNILEKRLKINPSIVGFDVINAMDLREQCRCLFSYYLTTEK